MIRDTLTRKQRSGVFRFSLCLQTTIGNACKHPQRRNEVCATAIAPDGTATHLASLLANIKVFARDLATAVGGDLCGAMGVGVKWVRRDIALKQVGHHVIKAGIGCTTVMARQLEYSQHSLTTGLASGSDPSRHHYADP